MTEQYDDPMNQWPLWKEYGFAIIIGLLFGWALVVRPPDFGGPSMRMILIAFFSLLWWVGIALLLVITFGGVGFP